MTVEKSMVSTTELLDNLVPSKSYNNCISEQTICDLLYKFEGNMAAVARALNVTRQAIQDRVNRSDFLKIVIQDTIEAGIDEAEDYLKQLIRDKHFPAINLYLRTIGKKRGYFEKRDEEQSTTIEVRCAADEIYDEIKKVPNDDDSRQVQS